MYAMQFVRAYLCVMSAIIIYVNPFFFRKNAQRTRLITDGGMFNSTWREMEQRLLGADM